MAAKIAVELAALSNTLGPLTDFIIPIRKAREAEWACDCGKNNHFRRTECTSCRRKRTPTKSDEVGRFT
jgi:hypothetical protein